MPKNRKIDTGLSYSKFAESLPTFGLIGANVLRSRDGDLQQLQANPLYSFLLESTSESTMQLPQRLDLGVSDVGVIGRRVSVMTSSTAGPRTVAEGIMGWN
jgi:hypothetical protein